MEIGYVLPKTLIVKVIPQLEDLAVDDVESHLFYNPAKKFPESFSEDEKTELTAAYVAMVKDKIIPAYKQLSQFMINEYMEAGRTTSGISDVPGGAEYYEYQIKY